MNNKKLQNQTASMEECTWEQVRETVRGVNAELAAIIDQISPDKKYTVFRVRCPYGSEILKKGQLQVPNKNGVLVPLNDSSLDPRLGELLGYNLGSNPVTLVVKNSLELFFPLEDRTVPFYGLIPAGKLFGAWRILSPGTSLQPKFMWDMTAGARSIFMLPKISEKERHNKLKKTLRLSAEIPKKLIDHWQVFTEIANHPQITQPWEVELLYFPIQWFENFDSPTWLPFHHYLLNIAWKSSELWRNQFVWNLIFSLIQERKNIKPSSYIADTVKHLFSIGIGALPGFAPAIDNTAAPIIDIQNAYLDIYNLKDYNPTIMQPQMFISDAENNRPVYYSLQFHTAIEFSLKSRERTSITTDLYEIMSLLNKYSSEVLHEQYNIDATPFYTLAKSTSFDFFHSDTKLYPSLIHSREIPKEDPSFNFCAGKMIEGDFPETTTFVRGCIRIK